MGVSLLAHASAKDVISRRGRSIIIRVHSSTTDRGWQALFRELPIEHHLDKRGLAFVTAKQIKEITKREPRLMTKFDTREIRPDTLRRAHCTVLPVRNGRYALVRGDGYANLREGDTPEVFLTSRKRQLESFPRICASESQAIDAAFVYGVLHHFLEDGDLVLTMRGRRRTPRFRFHFSGRESPHLSVDGVQIEIDSGYEGDKIYVLEAKMGARDNFIVRQLYYPTRMCIARGLKKTVVPLFLTYSNQVFTFSEFRFTEQDNYSSIVHVRTKSYLLETQKSKPVSIRAILGATTVGQEPLDIPFPQANDVRKVIDVIDAVLVGVAKKSEITRRYEFAHRQSAYYADAARYLGFLRPRGDGYETTTEGDRLVDLPAMLKVKAVVVAMARASVFRAGLEELVRSGQAPDRDFFAPLIGRARPEVKGTTIPRRAGAAAQWIKWVAKSLPLDD